jgi:prefoldin alpha subunit
MAQRKDLMHDKEHEDQRELQKKYMQYQIARQYVVALAEEKAALEARLAELSMTITAMQHLKDIKKGEEMWSTLGSDAFVMSDVKDASGAIVGVGAGVYVRKPLEEAVKTLNARHAELLEVDKQLLMEINVLNQQLARLEPEIQAAMAQMQEESKK